MKIVDLTSLREKKDLTKADIINAFKNAEEMYIEDKTPSTSEDTSILETEEQTKDEDKAQMSTPTNITNNNQLTHGIAEVPIDNCSKGNTSIDKLVQEINSREDIHNKRRLEHYIMQGEALRKLAEKITIQANKKKVTLAELTSKVGISKSNISKYISISKSVEIKKIVEKIIKSKMKLLEKLNIDQLAKVAKKEGVEFYAMLKKMIDDKGKEKAPNSKNIKTYRLDVSGAILKIDELEEDIKKGLSGVSLLEKISSIRDEIKNYEHIDLGGN